MKTQGSREVVRGRQPAEGALPSQLPQMEGTCLGKRHTSVTPHKGQGAGLFITSSHFSHGLEGSSRGAFPIGSTSSKVSSGGQKIPHSNKRRGWPVKVSRPALKW